MADITVRQNIQLHWVDIEMMADTPHIDEPMASSEISFGLSFRRPSVKSIDWIVTVMTWLGR